MDRGAWWATVQGVPKNWTQLSNFHFSPSTPADGHPETMSTHPFVSGCASVYRGGRGLQRQGDPISVGQLYPAQASLR